MLIFFSISFSRKIFLRLTFLWPKVQLFWPFTAAIGWLHRHPHTSKNFNFVFENFRRYHYSLARGRSEITYRWRRSTVHYIVEWWAVVHKRNIHCSYEFQCCKNNNSSLSHNACKLIPRPSRKRCWDDGHWSSQKYKSRNFVVEYNK